MVTSMYVTDGDVNVLRGVGYRSTIHMSMILPVDLIAKMTMFTRYVWKFIAIYFNVFSAIGFANTFYYIP